jgi:hypothetical protein
MKQVMRLFAALWLAALTAPVQAQLAGDGLAAGPRFLHSSSPSSTPVPVGMESSSALLQRLSLRLEGETMQDALDAISEKTGLHFIYSRDAIPVDRRIALRADDMPLGTVLAQLFHGIPIDLVFAPGGQVALVARAEMRVGEVTGRVVDAVTRGPIAGTRVEVLGAPQAATTDSAGAFRLGSVQTGVISLRATALGYLPFVQTDVVVATGRTTSVVMALSPAPIALGEVTVGTGFFAAPQEAPTSTQRLNPEEIRRSPGAQEDVVRAISLLPGVAPTPISSNALIVRGGAPFENLFVVDGLEVQDINHFGAQGSSGGFASLINLGVLRAVEFSAGGFSASHGDRVGSVTSLNLREGDTDRLAGEANLASTGFGAIVEGPVGRGSYIMSLRRSYLDLILKLSGETWITSYWDANAKIVQQLSSRDALSATFVGGIDDWDFNVETPDDLLDASIMAINLDQYFSALTWSRSGDRSLLEVTAGRVLYGFDTFQNDTLGATVFTSESAEAENSLRVKYARTLGNGGTVELGAIAKQNALDYDVDLPGFLRPDGDGVDRPLDVDTSFTAYRVGTYAEATRQWTSRFSTTLGSRLDYYDYLGGAIRWAPRVAASLGLGGTTSLNLSGGRYWQTPSFIWLVGDPSNPDNLRPIRVDQGVIGIQTLPREDLKVQIEAYYKRYASYPAREWRPQAVVTPGIEHVRADIPFGLEPLSSDGTGTAYGAELFLQKRLSTIPVYGVASLSLNRTRFEGADGVARVGAYDSPVSGSLAAGWRPNESWDFGLRFRAATGLPKTPYVDSGPMEGRLDFDRYHEGGRMPAFHALDLRIDRRWAFRSMQFTTYLDIQDLYNRDNPIAYTWDDREHAPHYERAIGLLPSIGVNVVF